MTKKVIETANGWYMKNDKEPVELDDIVGLVKTDEPTNSVQLKKEAQLCICEKRLIELEKENEQLKKELDYIQNSITEHIKHQKTELGQKALKEIIADYNEWMLGHKELEE